MKTPLTSPRIFYPVSSADFNPTLKKGQRYRSDFGDKRLSRCISSLQDRMIKRQSAVINQLGTDKSEKERFYNVLKNEHVESAELIDCSCRIAPICVQDKFLLALMDTCATGLASQKKEKNSAESEPAFGVIEDNRTPGFFMHSCLVVEASSGHVVGLGDIVLHERPKTTLSPKENSAIRNLRTQLPLEEKESYVWALAAKNTFKRLGQAKQVVYVMDQGGDNYASLVRILSDNVGAHLIVRSKTDRSATYTHTDESKSTEQYTACLSELLAKQAWQSVKETPIRALNHYSKSSNKLVQRKARKAKLQLRFIQVQLNAPAHYKGSLLTNCITVIEVLEHHSTVPEGEEPIHWRLLSTLSCKDSTQAWQIVQCYEMRWFIEQLFRVYKKKGFNIERSQLKKPEAIKKQAVLALKGASQVLQLTLAREGKTHIPIETVFATEQEITVLNQLNKKLSGKTKKTSNQHLPNTLAWAAWLIARLGGWNGYQKARPPGPITMHRGLTRFYDMVWTYELMNSS